MNVAEGQGTYLLHLIFSLTLIFSFMGIVVLLIAQFLFLMAFGVKKLSYRVSPA